jgi:hypothetical protein
MNKRFYCIVLIGIVLAGCAPAPTVYYKPKATGGKLTRTYDDESELIAPRDGIKFEWDGVKITISGHQSSMVINLGILCGTMASFLSSEIKIYDALGAEDILYFNEICHQGSKREGRVCLYPTDTMKGVKRRVSNRFEIHVNFDLKQTDQYRLQLPSMWINGKIFKFPEIEFTKEVGFRVFQFCL